MKLQILQLDPNDDRTSIQDKLSRVQADRVLLVWPRRGRPLVGRLDLTLVQRKAIDFGLQLGVLSHDPPLLDEARRLDVPVFESIEDASERQWPDRPAPRYPKRPSRAPRPSSEDSPEPTPSETKEAGGLPGWLRYLLFVFALLSLAALTALILPNSTIEIQPALAPRQQSLIVWIIPEEFKGEPPAGSIIGQSVQANLSASDRIESTGSSQVAERTSAGTLLFTNLTDAAVNIPAGTSVRTSLGESTRFVTTQSAQLPAGQGEQTTAPAEAALPGEEGNIAEGLIDAVDGALGLSIQVTNPAAFSGGSNRPQPVVSRVDQTRLAELVEQILIEEGRQRLQSGLPPSRRLLIPSVRLEPAPEMVFDVEPGEAAASLGLTMEGRVTGLTYPINEVEAAITSQLSAPDPDGWRLVPGTLDFTPQEASQDGSAYGLNALASWQAYQPVDVYSIKQSVRGQESDSNWRQLEDELKIQVLSSQLKPAWLPFYPLLANRIYVRYPWQGG